MKVTITDPENSTEEILIEQFWEGLVSIEYDPSDNELKFGQTEAGKLLAEHLIKKLSKK